MDARKENYVYKKVLKELKRLHKNVKKLDGEYMVFDKYSINTFDRLLKVTIRCIRSLTKEKPSYIKMSEKIQSLEKKIEEMNEEINKAYSSGFEDGKTFQKNVNSMKRYAEEGSLDYLSSKQRETTESE